MIGRNGERGSGISALAARYDDDDDIYIYIYIYVCVCVCVCVCYLANSLKLLIKMGQIRLSHTKSF